MLRLRFLNQKFTLREIWKLRSCVFKILLSSRKIINFVLVCFSWIFKKTKILNSPLGLMIEPSSRCDMVCPMCPVILNKTNRTKGDMLFDTFTRVLDDIGDRLLFIALWNYGEPLLNKNIFSMIKYAHAKSVITIMSTNALSLDREKINNLLESKLDYLIVSFDGATPSTYEKFRGKGNFTKVLNNLILLLEEKKRQHRRLPFVDLQYIVMKDNEHEINDIKILARQLGVDKLSLKKFTYVGGDEVSLFLVSQEKYLFGKYKGIDYSNGCMRVFDSSVILWDGTVVPCCGDLDFKYVFGNVNTEGGFMPIWNNASYTAFRRKALEDIKSIAICNRCPSKDYNIDMFIQ